MASVVSTAVFATCGMPLWRFLVSATISLPKQFALVYSGTNEDQSGSESSCFPTPRAHTWAPTLAGIASKTAGLLAKAAIIVVTIGATVFAMRYINRRVDEVKEGVVYARRKARWVLPTLLILH